jgi:hypothetical protein
VGHYLGLDVHDTNTIGPHRTLEAGVVLALEPGLYIPNHPQFGRYAGIGVRIEDDVLVTHQGAEVLSADAPIDADEVEALVGTGVAVEQQPMQAAAAAAGGHSGSESDQQELPAGVMSAA